MKKIKILVVSAAPWNTSLSFGNSYSDIFAGIDNFEIANVYLSNGFVNDAKVSRAFEVTEDMLVRNLINKKNIVGHETPIITSDFCRNESIQKESLIQKIKGFGLNHRYSLIYACRDFLWKIGRWESKELIQFINEFHPDVLFAPINGSSYPNNIIFKLSKRFNLPIVGYISDDNYTFQQFNLSPFYWIRRFLLRRSVGRIIKESKVLYVISSKQKEVYDRIFGISSKILTKGFKDRRSLIKEPTFNQCLNIVFTGNLNLNRWKTVAIVANVVSKLNCNGEKINLNIYSGTKLTKEMSHALDGKGVYFKGKVSPAQVHDIQKNADILLHVEATDFFHKWDALYSFSTKLVDYFSEGKPILALGDAKQASISYLKENDAAFVATNEKELSKILESIISNKNILNEYAKKSFQCGEKNHSANHFKQMLIHDIESVKRNTSIQQL